MATHIDALQEYSLLVGEADGGCLLPQSEFDALVQQALRIHREGMLALFVPRRR